MKKFKEFFSDISFIFETIWAIIILVFEYPLYRKSLKEMWKSITEHLNIDKDKY